jgi:hypothetical protein
VGLRQISLILDKDGKLQLIHSLKKIVSIMNKKAYQQPTMNVVKLQHKSHILTASVTGVDGNASLKYGGAGGNHEANSRGGGWDEE